MGKAKSNKPASAGRCTSPCGCRQHPRIWARTDTDTDIENTRIINTNTAIEYHHFRQ